MPTRVCFVCQYSEYSFDIKGKGIRFFSFPRGKNKKHLLKKWLEFCRLPHYTFDDAYWKQLGFDTCPQFYLCSLHFTDKIKPGMRINSSEFVPEKCRPFGPDHCQHDSKECCRIVDEPEKEITATYMENFGNADQEQTNQACSGEEILTNSEAMEEPEFFVLDNDETIVSTGALENVEASAASAQGCDHLGVSGPLDEGQGIPSSSELSSVQSHPSRIRVQENLIHNLKDKLCRICGKNKEPLIPIQNEDELSVELTLTEKLEMYLPLEIKLAEPLPPNICLKCYKLVELWHELYIACSAADSLFRELFGATRKEDTSELEEEEMRLQKDDLQDTSTPEKEVPTTFLPANKIRMNIKRKRNSQNRRGMETNSKFYKSYQVLKGKFRGKPVNFVMKPFSCEYCHAIFATWEEYHPHTEKCKLEPTICEDCGEVISEKASLKKHMRTHLKIPKTQDENHFFICEICGKILISKMNLKYHKDRFHSSENVEKEHTNYC